MKIRNGFVSNSSSSSFVVALPHKPESAEDLKQMMFGKQDWHYAGIYYETQDVSTKDIADSVFSSISKKATKKEIYESIRSGWFEFYIHPDILPGMYNPHEETRELDYKKDAEKINLVYEKANKINDKRALDIANAFIRENKGKFIFVVSYSDNDSPWHSLLEHSGIFHRLPHITTSYH